MTAMTETDALLACWICLKWIACGGEKDGWFTNYVTSTKLPIAGWFVNCISIINSTGALIKRGLIVTLVVLQIMHVVRGLLNSGS